MAADRKRVYMTLPQSPAPQDLTIHQQEKIYQKFRSRVNIKSSHKYFDNAEKPVLLRVHLNGSIFDSVIELLVTCKSFVEIYSQTDIPKKEIGFKCEVRSIDGTTYRLVVLRYIFKAYMEKVNIDKNLKPA